MTPFERYRERKSRFGDELEAVEARSDRTRLGRIAAFLAAVLALLGAEWTAGAASALLGTAGGAAAIGFLWLVGRHRQLKDAAARLRELVRVNREALARLRRDWDSLPEAPRREELSDHPYAEDLDVVGRASVLRLLSTVATAPGDAFLRDWMLSAAPTGQVEARQEAVRELAPAVDYRQEFTAAARRAGVGPGDDVEPFLAWAEGDSWLEDRPWLLWVARLLPVANAGLMAAHASGATAYPWWALGLAVALGVSGVAGARVHTIFDRVTRREENVGRYASLLRRLEELPGEADLLAECRRDLRGPPDAVRALERLERLISASDVRHNALAHLPLQVLFLWDVHLLWLLERWQERVGGEVRRWFRATGRAEAVLGLAALRFDHPEWCFPRLEPGRETLQAGELGHPLLPPEDCVHNDVEVGPPGTFLLVTGSNMSGKSTLLRSIGLAAVLAQAGAPVPASSLRLPPLAVHTSMQVEDSLSEGVSEFMAELRRVRRVVEAAEGARDGTSEDDGEDARVLYLLDEPLQGTNEDERRRGLRVVLRRLVASEAIGAVATHDLRVHRTPALEPAAEVVHLTGQVEEGEDGPRLSFGYRLRPGLAPSTNALALMESMGLAEPGDR